MDNRVNILNCALRLFASQGYDSVGVQKICEEAGITKPTLYYYFKSKHGLLDTLLSDYFQTLYQMVESAATYHGDLSLSLSGVTTAYFSFAKEHAAFYRLQLSLYFAPPQHEAHKLAAGFQERQFRLVKNLFLGAIHDYLNLKGREDYATATFIGLVDHWISLALNNYIELDSALVHQTVQQFLYGILSSR